MMAKMLIMENFTKFMGFKQKCKAELAIKGHELGFSTKCFYGALHFERVANSGKGLDQ